MQGELISDGKKYISASRASKLCGYNSDYIGQLCRRGALDCKMVGRAWFVEEESLKNHKVVASSTPRGRIPIHQKNAAQNSSAAISKLSPEISHSFHSIQQEWESFVNEPEDKTQTAHFVQRLVAGVVVLVLILVAGTTFSTNKFAVVSRVSDVANLSNLSNVFGSTSLSFGETFNDFLQSAHRGFVYANNFLQDASRKVRVIVMNAGINSDTTNIRERLGVAVLPSANNDAENDIVKKYVTDSFSDEVEIVPDESGNSGLIKPEFKRENDQDYVYVIVPVKDGQKASQKN